MVTLFKTSSCAYCPMVAKYLQSKGIEFNEVNIDNDQEIRSQLYSKTGYMTVPVTTNGKEYIVGWNPSKLARFVNNL